MRLKDDEFVRCKDIGEISHGVSYTPNDLRDRDDGILILRACNIQDSVIVFDDNVYVDAKCVEETKKLCKGDILICGTNGSLRLVGKSAIIPSDDCGAFGSFMLRLRVKGNNQFVQYQLSALVDRCRGLFSTVTINQLTATQLATMKFWWPNDLIQRRIVSYLDEKTAAIDARVAVMEKKLAAYKRLKTSVINRAVTRGLDPNAKLKDSGVDWIGKVPAGWKVRRIKDVAKPLQYGASEVGLEYDPDLPRYIRITDITQDGELKDDGAQSLSEEIARPYLLIDGDILLARSGATVGKAFVYCEKYGRAAFAGYMIRCRVDPSCGEFRFVYYWMLSSFYQAWKQRAISQATIQNIGADKYANLVLPLPNIAEQFAIADYLDAECAKIDKMAALVAQEIELYKSLKRSLINEVVTGKREVA